MPLWSMKCKFVAHFDCHAATMQTCMAQYGYA